MFDWLGFSGDSGLFDDSDWYPSMDDPMGTDDLGSLLGAQGPSQSGQQHLGRQAQAPQMQNSQSILNSLMSQVGRPPQYKAPGAPWQHGYVSSLMNV